ncbi:hypothetical protein [Microbacterium sp. MYb64]|uniref:hypothetical protein n=1 Tax=Microbacterium sp. MYb64 TaxID=1848691 RepID=UPI000D4333B2|nr:hypothetical protein [Microbacterium sp. MYb64]PRB02325.1 hypothetical protein CQ044_15665 [Microbacterium sp. MYb64]
MVHVEPVSAYPPATSRTLEQWLAVVSALFLNRVRRWVPRPGTSLSVRGPGNLRSGLWTAGGILLLVNVFLVIGALTSGRVLSMVFVDLGMVLLLASVLVVPSATLGRSRPILRRQAHEDPRLAATLEQERLSWTPDGRTPVFGPL